MITNALHIEEEEIKLNKYIDNGDRQGPDLHSVSRDAMEMTT